MLSPRRYSSFLNLNEHDYAGGNISILGAATYSIVKCAMKSAIYIFSIMCASAVYAGGDYFPVKIIEISSDSDTFNFKAEPTNERQWMDEECSVIFVKGRYDTLRWLMYKRPMSLEKHMRSIEYLSKSMTLNTTVYFGYIGNGLHKVGKCTYESKGLVYENYDKEFVLSVHDRI